MACFTLESLDTLRCVYPEETVQNFDLIGKSRCYRKGEVGRSVPGWLLAYPVFDRLLCMYAFYSKNKPIRVRIMRSPGFHYVHDHNHTYSCLNTPDVQRWTASVFFASPDRSDRESHLDEPDLLASEEEPDHMAILLDRAFHCGHLHHVEKMASLQTAKCAPVNPLWWSLAETTYTSTLASTCGCH